MNIASSEDCNKIAKSRLDFIAMNKSYLYGIFASAHAILFPAANKFHIIHWDISRSVKKSKLQMSTIIETLIFQEK